MFGLFKKQKKLSESKLEEIGQIFYEKRLILGRMISGSKSGYRQTYPNREPIFNSNIIVEGTKVWFGDIDLVSDAQKLQEIANEIQMDLYILREMDARFDNEGKDFKFYKNKAVKKISPRKS